MMKKLFAILLTVSLIICPLNAYAKTQAHEQQSQIIENVTTDESIVLNSSTVTASGYLDVVSASQIGGWAWRSDIPNTPINVHLYIRKTTETDSTVIGVTANGYREDLERKGYGNGYHSFSYPIDWTTYTPGTYEVRAYAIGGNGINPQLSNSPKNFTVQAATGDINTFNDRVVAGYAWKPDAPNKAIRVHIYIRRMNWDVVDIYPIVADDYSPSISDIGNGFHGFSYSFDWDSLPEERLAVEVYAVDGSGHHPRLFLGYYDNRKPIYLLSETDSRGHVFSYWVNNTIRDYCYDIGCSDCAKLVGFNNFAAMNRIANSSFCVIDSHGGEDWFECNYQGDFTYVTTELLEEDTTRDYSTTRCVLLLSCENGLGGKNNQNNIANTLWRKGVGTVVAFSTTIGYNLIPGTLNVDPEKGCYFWAREFLKYLAQGYTVRDAYDEALEELEERHNGDTYGIENEVIVGNENQIVKH